jgi:DNA-binding transcriptional LysR family regulator
MIEGEWLASFVAFSETMNFTHAAQRRHISQPALHVQIRRLGEELGVALYVRKGRTLTLTAAGQKVLAFARDQRERTERLLEEVTGVAQPQTVVLAAGEGSFLYLLRDALRTFQSGRHGQLRVLTRDRDGAMAAVQLGEAHLAVTATDEIPSSLTARRIARVGAAAILPKTHPLARKRRLALRELRDEPIIAPAQGRPLRATLAHAWSEMGATWAPAVEANGWELMMRFAALGMGIAVVNDFCTPPAGTVCRPLAGLPVVQYQLLRARGRTLNTAAEALAAAIVARVE